jgi:phosphatidyl-myo-inositol dimannoside synthase
MPEPLDILLSQKFLPEPGGSIRWMYEVYRRWPRPVQVITHDYYRVPPNTPEFATVPPPPDGRDHVTDANLLMDRRDIFINDWGVESPARVRRYLRMTGAVAERFRDRANRGRTIRVHCTHAVPEVVSLIPLRWRYGRRLRVISYAHGEEVTACCSSRQLRFLMHRAHGIIDLMIANSRNTARLLEGHIDASKVHLVHPGVQLDEFAAAEEAGQRWRREQGLDGRLVVLTVGRLDPRKNHAAVIDAVAALAQRYPTLTYVVAGDGRQMGALKAQASSRGVAERVVFTGAVGGATKLGMFGGCDVFAMPAIRDGTDVEGFGMVFIEAGACGKAVLAGREGGQPEAVEDGQTGLVVDGTDPAAVAAALDRLLGDPPLRGRLGEHGRAHARTLDWSAVVQRTVELVEETA